MKTKRLLRSSFSFLLILSILSSATVYFADNDSETTILYNNCNKIAIKFSQLKELNCKTKTISKRFTK